jgi:hypothetical protein
VIRDLTMEIPMPRPRPPGLHREVTRHGKTVWYVRIDHGPRIRIHAAFGTPEFQAEYQAALAGQPLPGAALPRDSVFAPRTLGGSSPATGRVLEPGGLRGRGCSGSRSCAMPLQRQAGSRWPALPRRDGKEHGGSPPK